MYSRWWLLTTLKGNELVDPQSRTPVPVSLWELVVATMESSPPPCVPQGLFLGPPWTACHSLSTRPTHPG